MLHHYRAEKKAPPVDSIEAISDNVINALRSWLNEVEGDIGAGIGVARKCFVDFVYNVTEIKRLLSSIDTTKPTRIYLKRLAGAIEFARRTKKKNKVLELQFNVLDVAVDWLIVLLRGMPYPKKAEIRIVRKITDYFMKAFPHAELVRFEDDDSEEEKENKYKANLQTMKSILENDRGRMVLFCKRKGKEIHKSMMKTDLSTNKAAYCRCLYHVAEKQPDWCLREKAWGVTRDGKKCWNPYSTCRNKHKFKGKTSCFPHYNLDQLTESELDAIQLLKGYESREEMVQDWYKLRETELLSQVKLEKEYEDPPLIASERLKRRTRKIRRERSPTPPLQLSRKSSKQRSKQRSESPPPKRSKQRTRERSPTPPLQMAPSTLPLPQSLPQSLPPTLYEDEDDDEATLSVNSTYVYTLILLSSNTYTLPIRFTEEETVGRTTWKGVDDTVSRVIVTLTKVDGNLYATAQRDDVYLTNSFGVQKLKLGEKTLIHDGDEINQRNFRFKILINM